MCKIPVCKLCGIFTHVTHVEYPCMLHASHTREMYIPHYGECDPCELVW